MSTLIGILGVALFLALVALAVARLERRRRAEARRQEVLDALAERFALAPAAERLIEGRVGSRRVRVGFETDYLLRGWIALGSPALPPDVRVLELADGPYQKHEELYFGAHPTGDKIFDARFLVYCGTVEQAQALPADLRGFLLTHPLDGLWLAGDEVSLPLPLEPAAAVSTLEQALAFCESLEAALQR